MGITTDLTGDFDGWLEIEIGGRAQRLSVIACPRPFGGRQWYFICPRLGRRASVLWQPPGARHFRIRQGMGAARRGLPDAI